MNIVLPFGLGKINLGWWHLKVLLWALVFAAYTPVGQSTTLPSDPPLDNPVLESQAQDIFQRLRCVACDHQRLSDSEVALADVMRQHIRRELASGSSPQAVIDWMVQRYGAAIRLDTPTLKAAWPAWIMVVAVVVVLIMAGLIYFGWRGAKLGQAVREDLRTLTQP